MLLSSDYLATLFKPPVIINTTNKRAGVGILLRINKLTNELEILYMKRSINKNDRWKRERAIADMFHFQVVDKKKVKQINKRPFANLKKK